MYGLFAYVDERGECLYSSCCSKVKKYNSFDKYEELQYELRCRTTNGIVKESIIVKLLAK